MPKNVPVSGIDRRFGDEGTATGGHAANLSYISVPTFTTGAYLGASALNTLTDNLAWLQAHRSKRSVPQPLPTAPQNTWEWRYMCVHQFDSLVISYTIGTDEPGSDPSFKLINSANPSGISLGSFDPDVGTHTYTIDISSFGFTVGDRYRILINHVAADDSTFEMRALYELDS